MIVLSGTGCGSTRRISRDTVTAHETRATTNIKNLRNVMDSVGVAVRDSVTITKTIMITENEAGDTVSVSTVTNRDRIRDREWLRVNSSELRIERDTVYIERNDSIRDQDSRFTVHGNQSGKTALGGTLKWVFALIIALCVLRILKLLNPVS